MPRPLIVGQSPARGNDGLPPFSGKSGARLARLAGVGNSGDVLSFYFQLVNLIGAWPGKEGKKGDRFDLQLAQKRAWAIKGRLRTASPRSILLMGWNVGRAWGWPQYLGYLEWRSWRGHRICVFPHPSGINHWWNSELHTRLARDLLREVADESQR